MKTKDMVIKFLISNNIPLDVFEIYCFKSGANSVGNTESYHDISMCDESPHYNIAIGNKELDIEHLIKVNVDDKYYFLGNTYKYMGSVSTYGTAGVASVLDTVKRYKLNEFLK